MRRLPAFLFSALFAGVCHAHDIQVAVASNFAAPMKALAAGFERDSGHRLLITPGATGTFYAQIRNGAPFELLLAADDETPARLAAEGAGEGSSRFTYAIGRLVLWSAQPALVDAQGAILNSGKFAHLAIANPKVAPYGAAALEVLTKLQLLSALEGRFVQGENISQTYQFIVSGNAPLGFVAMSQVYAEGKLSAGSAWVVPASMHAPIRQDAIILKQGQGKPAVAALVAYLRSDKARALIRSYGYEL
jgi:molybdate transport system substrate-binding protein